MHNELLHLFIPYASAGAAWVVRREASMVTSHVSQWQAMQGALAYVASRGLQGSDEFVIRLQGEDGNWHEADSAELSQQAPLA